MRSKGPLLQSLRVIKQQKKGGVESLYIFVKSLRKMYDLGRDTKLINAVLYKSFL